MPTERSGPREPVRDVIAAKEAGSDLAVLPDHCSPWPDTQDHSPCTWFVLGAATQAIEYIPAMTYVACPTMRRHPAGVGQPPPEGGFRLGLGAGEDLDEQMAGRGRPSADRRQIPPRPFPAVATPISSPNASSGVGTGFTGITPVRTGDVHQKPFLAWAHQTLLSPPRKAAGHE